MAEFTEPFGDEKRSSHDEKDRKDRNDDQQTFDLIWHKLLSGMGESYLKLSLAINYRIYHFMLLFLYYLTVTVNVTYRSFFREASVREVAGSVSQYWQSKAQFVIWGRYLCKGDQYRNVLSIKTISLATICNRRAISSQ